MESRNFVEFCSILGSKNLFVNLVVDSIGLASFHLRNLHIFRVIFDWQSLETEMVWQGMGY